MIDEEYKENVEYMNSVILPQLQETQREVLKNPSRLTLDISVRNDNGEGYISSFACVRNGMGGKITDTCYPRSSAQTAKRRWTSSSTSSKSSSRSTQPEN